ncbi:hypothetical protein V6N13_143675 [Hibiscus sabdariffa]|uniref:Transcriptional regulator family protein n=1 Tax=Hibiscus sabdariffa TaxID=183260 RepID=A0ABR2FIK2_9ROSI
MASRKKEPEGIALLSMYNDEDDEDMEDIEEDDHQQAEGQHDQSPLEENDHGESNIMEEDSRTEVNTPPFPHQTSTSSQHQRLGSSKSSGRGKLNIVNYGHDEAAVSPEHEQVELGSNDDLMFGLEHQIANVDFQGKTSPAAVQGTPDSDVEPLQPEANNAVSESAGDKVDPLDKFLPSPSKDKCSEELQRKIDKFLYLKRAGKSYNAEVRNKKDYRNPDFLLHAVQYQDIDQLGSCFIKDVFDPHGYDKTDFYDEIEADMKRERERKEQESKRNLKVEYVSAGSQPGTAPTAPKLGIPIAAVTPAGLPSAPTAVDNIMRDGRQNKKSKWDKVDSDGRNPRPAGGQDSASTVGAHTVLLSSANPGTGYTAFAQQKRRETKEKRSSEKRLDRRS